MKTILFFLIIILSFNIMSQDIKISIKQNTGAKDITIKPKTFNKCINSLQEIVANIDQILRVRLDDERIDELKKTEKYLEIFLDKSYIVKDKTKNEIHFSKVLIFLTGDFGASKKSDQIFLLVGEGNSYESAPYRSVKSYNKLECLINCINKLKK